MEGKKGNQKMMGKKPLAHNPKRLKAKRTNEILNTLNKEIDSKFPVSKEGTGLEKSKSETVNQATKKVFEIIFKSQIVALQSKENEDWGFVWEVRNALKQLQYDLLPEKEKEETQNPGFDMGILCCESKYLSQSTWKSFSLKEKTLQTLETAFNMSAPTEVQVRTLTALSREKNVLVVADPTSGKTLSHLLYAIEKLKWKEPGFRVIILQPLHKIVMQTLSLGSLLINKPIEIQHIPSLSEKNPYPPSDLPKILVSTPDNLLNKIKFEPDYMENLEYLELVIYDGANLLFEKYENEIKEIGQIISHLQPQIGMFTPTLTDKIRFMKSKGIIENFELINVPSKGVLHRTQYYEVCSNYSEILKTLFSICAQLHGHKTVLILCQTTQLAEAFWELFRTNVTTFHTAFLSPDTYNLPIRKNIIYFGSELFSRVDPKVDLIVRVGLPATLEDYRYDFEWTTNPNGEILLLLHEKIDNTSMVNFLPNIKQWYLPKLQYFGEFNLSDETKQEIQSELLPSLLSFYDRHPQTETLDFDVILKCLIQFFKFTKVPPQKVSSSLFAHNQKLHTSLENLGFLKYDGPQQQQDQEQNGEKSENEEMGENENEKSEGENKNQDSENEESDDDEIVFNHIEENENGESEDENEIEENEEQVSVDEKEPKREDKVNGKQESENKEQASVEEEKKEEYTHQLKRSFSSKDFKKPPAAIRGLKKRLRTSFWKRKK